MSFDQSLISHSQDGLYAAAWVAGTSGDQALSKYYKSHDIESVNVPKTCDKINLALRSRLQQEAELKNCIVRGNGNGIPFRICSNLFFGTLKIYQQQVNNLYMLSEDLVTKSSKYEIHKPAIKRKNTSNLKIIKKRRLTITNSNEYSQLLEDLDKLAQEVETNLEEDKLSPKSVPSIETLNKRQTSAKFQIREITIREINATYGIPELDDDCGFGEATNDEIIEFFSFSGNQVERQRTPSKRKCSSVEEPLKRPRITNGEYLATLIKEPSPKQKSDYEEYVGQKQSLDHDCIPVNTGLNCNISFNTLSQNNTYNRDETLADNMNPQGTSPKYLNYNIKEEYDSDHEFTNINALNKPIDVKFVIEEKTIKEERNENIEVIHTLPSKLIIDQCIKLEVEEMFEQLHKPQKDLRGVIKNILSKSKLKKRTSAMMLLKRYNKRTTQLRCLTLKLKSYNDSIKLQQDYLNLLRDIFKTDYKSEWASEIYPKWQNSSTTLQKPTKQKQIEKTHNTDNKQTISCDFLPENNDLVVHDCKDDNIGWENTINPWKHLNCQTLPKNIDDQENVEDPSISKEWRPYGVMTKLLKMWRYSTSTEINANDFCNSARVQIYKALAFSSLLTLLKSRFIFITKQYHTIQMDKITLGVASKNLIETT